jgi:PAS domain-containing protein
MCAPDRPDPEGDFPLRVVAYRVVEKCASGLVVLGLGGEILDVNPAFCELTGRGMGHPGDGVLPFWLPWLCTHVTECVWGSAPHS